MKGAIRFVLLILPVWLSHLPAGTSQQKAMFEHPVYFEDGLGNRDTIIIGGDTSATHGLNPEFGEVPITTPFDSVFEVRAIEETEWWKPNPILLKKVIGWSEKVFGFPEPCENIVYFRMVIHIRHLPLKISWDSSLYADSLCILGSYVTSGELAITIGPWTLSLNPEDENLAYCVAQHDSIILDIGQGLYPWNLYRDFLYEVEGGTVDTMLILEWDFDYAGSSLVCGHIVSTDDPFSTNPVDDPFDIYPNPVIDLLTIRCKESGYLPEGISIFDAQGRTLYAWKQGIDNAAEIHTVHTANWPPGIYFVRGSFRDGTAVRKVVKL